MEWLAEPYRYTRPYLAMAMVLATAGVALALSGCLRDTLSARLTRHNHQKHAEMTAECNTCHNTAEAGAEVRPSHKNCADCHDIDMEKPGDACLQCHVVPKTRGGSPSPELLKKTITEACAEHAAARKARRAATPWDHSLPEGKVKCIVCHGDVLAGPRKDPREYHRGNDAPGDCATCHATNRKDVRPRNHAERQAWTLTHGAMSQSGQMPGCKTCHRTAFCDDCHRTERPRSHNAMFRDRGHGFAAAGDRRRCAVCHQQDFCEACHQHVAPPSHTAAFRSTGHCRSCHEVSTRQAKCQVCHTRALGQHTPVPSIPPGRTLHNLPQGFGADLHNDCTVPCHHP